MERLNTFLLSGIDLSIPFRQNEKKILDTNHLLVKRIVSSLTWNKWNIYKMGNSNLTLNLNKSNSKLLNSKIIGRSTLPRRNTLIKRQTICWTFTFWQQSALKGRKFCVASRGLTKCPLLIEHLSQKNFINLYKWGIFFNRRWWICLFLTVLTLTW